LFREHILGQLRKKGWSYKKAVNHLLFHNKIFCPIINEIFVDILACSVTGVKALLNRNPSLHRGSMQAIRITRIKVDPDDNTISMSYLIAKSFNADYDGRMLPSLNLLNCGNPLRALFTKHAYKYVCG